MNKKDTDKALTELKEWLKTQPHMPKCAAEDENTLKAFISGCYSVDLAKLKLDAYYSLRGKYKDEFFGNRDPKAIKWYSVKKYIFLPGTTPSGDHVILTSFPPKEVQKYYSPNESAKFNFMLIDTYLKEYDDYKPLGLYLLTDMANLTDEVLTITSEDYSRHFSEVMEAYPVKVKGTILFNVPHQELYNDYTKVLCNDFGHKIHVEKDHRSISKYIPLELLPSDYEGGCNLPVKAIWESTKQRIERERAWFLSTGSQCTNEALRP